MFSCNSFCGVVAWYITTTIHNQLLEHSVCSCDVPCLLLAAALGSSSIVWNRFRREPVEYIGYIYVGTLIASQGNQRRAQKENYYLVSSQVNNEVNVIRPISPLHLHEPGIGSNGQACHH